MDQERGEGQSCDLRSERADRVHGATGRRPTDEHGGGQGEPDGDSHRGRRHAVVGGHGDHDEGEQERDDDDGGPAVTDTRGGCGQSQVAVLLCRVAESPSRRVAEGGQVASAPSTAPIACAIT